jgi:hypothetical protein
MKREPINILKLPDYDQCVREQLEHDGTYVVFPGPPRKRYVPPLERKFMRLHARKLQRGRNL